MQTAKRRLRRDTIVAFTLLAVPLVMTNPPVLGIVSDYAVDHPLMFGLPTFWLWLEVWYFSIPALLIGFGLWMPSWRSKRLEEEVEQLPKHDYRED